MSERIDWEHVMEVGYDHQLSWSEYSSLKNAQKVSRGYYNKVRRQLDAVPPCIKKSTQPRQVPTAATDTGSESNVTAERLSIQAGCTPGGAGNEEDGKIKAILAEAREGALEASRSDITVEVVGVIRPRLTSLCAGYKGTKSMYRWLNGNVPTALNGGKGPRLRFAFDLIWILGKLGLRTLRIKAWFDAVHAGWV